MIFLASQASSGDRTLEGLVVLLGAPSREARDRAEESIAAMGPSVLDDLGRIEPDTTGETRLRVARLIARLERSMLESSVEPAHVTLAAKDLSARALLERIAEQSGNRIELADDVMSGPAGERRVSIAVERATYWEAIDETMRGANLALDCSDQGEQLRITAASGRRPPGVATGPLFVMLPRIERGGTPKARSLKLTVRLVWEPRLSPLVIRLPMESVQAEGPAGEAIPPTSRLAVLEAAVGPDSRWVDITLPFSAIDHPPDSLGMVRGTVRLWLAAGEHDFERAIAEDRPPARIRVGDAEVTFSALERSGRRLRVAAQVAYDRPEEPLASHRMWLTDRELMLVPDPDDAAAAPMRPDRQRVERRRETGLDIAAEFTLPETVGKRAVVRWRLPAGFREVPVEFIIRNVPLP